jgi:hypothetical protein
MSDSRTDDNSHSQTRKPEPPGRHRVGPKRFRCMRRRPLHRSNISVAAVATRMPVVLDDHCARVSAIDPQSRLLSDARRSDDGLQGAVACLRVNGQRRKYLTSRGSAQVRKGVSPRIDCRAGGSPRSPQSIPRSWILVHALYPAGHAKRHLRG